MVRSAKPGAWKKANKTMYWAVPLIIASTIFITWVTGTFTKWH
jgi:hypothetical protein